MQKLNCAKIWNGLAVSLIVAQGAVVWAEIPNSVGSAQGRALGTMRAASQQISVTNSVPVRGPIHKKHRSHRQPEKQIVPPSPIRVRLDPTKPAPWVDPHPENAFGNTEYFDAQDPAAVPRLMAVLREDPEVAQLLLDVQNALDGAAPESVFVFQIESGSFEDGSASAEVVDPALGSPLPGWIALQSDGHLPQRPLAANQIKVAIRLRKHAPIANVFTTVVHEMTHLRQNILNLRSGAPEDELNYKTPYENALAWIYRPGGEVDAFRAEIAALIRYRVRHHADYDVFHTAIREKYFDYNTGLLLKPQAFADDIAKAGGVLSYVLNYQYTYINQIKADKTWLEDGITALSNHLVSAPADTNAQEELTRLQTRLQQMESIPLQTQIAGWGPTSTENNPSLQWMQAHQLVNVKSDF